MTSLPWLVVSSCETQAVWHRVSLPTPSNANGGIVALAGLVAETLPTVNNIKMAQMIFTGIVKPACLLQPLSGFLVYRRIALDKSRQNASIKRFSNVLHGYIYSRGVRLELFRLRRETRVCSGSRKRRGTSALLCFPYNLDDSEMNRTVPCRACLDIHGNTNPFLYLILQLTCRRTSN